MSLRVIFFISVIITVSFAATTTSNCNVDFDNPDNFLILDAGAYQLQQSSVALRLFAKRNDGSLFGDEFLQLVLEQNQEFDKWEWSEQTAQGDAIDFLSPGAFTSCIGSVTTNNYIDQQGKYIGQTTLMINFTQNNGGIMTTLLHYFNDSTILYLTGGINVTVSPGAVKLNMELSNWPFLNSTNYLQTALAVTLKTTALPELTVSVSFPPGFENYTTPGVWIADTSLTAVYIKVLVSLQQWIEIGGEVLRAKVVNPDESGAFIVDVENSFYGARYYQNWQNFDHVYWDPSLSILFFGDDVQTPPTPPTAGVPVISGNPFINGPTTPTDLVGDPNNQGIGTGGIAAIIVVLVIVIAAGIAGGFYWKKRVENDRSTARLSALQRSMVNDDANKRATAVQPDSNTQSPNTSLPTLQPPPTSST